MLFKLLNCYMGDAGSINLSGVYIPESDDEKEGMEILKEELTVLNKIGTYANLHQGLYTENGKLLVRSLPMYKLHTLLFLHHESLDFDLKLCLGRNVKNSKYKDEIKNYFESKGMVFVD